MGSSSGTESSEGADQLVQRKCRRLGKYPYLVLLTFFRGNFLTSSVICISAEEEESLEEETVIKVFPSPSSAPVSPVRKARGKGLLEPSQRGQSK